MNYNKKGISAVVATVLIILITVAAVTIIWAAIIPMVKTQLDRGTICLDAMSQVTLENKGYTCYENSTGSVKFQVGHGASEIGLTGLQVLVSTGGNTVSTEVDATSLEPNTELVFNTTFDNSTAPDTVAIAPVVLVGNADATCDALAPVALKHC